MSHKYFKRKNNKYNSKKTKCLEGQYHPSVLEAEYCNQLRFLKQNGDIFDYKIQPVFRLYIDGVKITTHKPDFKIWRTEEDFEKDIYEIHETKGFETALWDIKHKLFRVLYPNIKYVVVK